MSPEKSFDELWSKAQFSQRGNTKWIDNCIICSSGSHYNNGDGDLGRREARGGGGVMRTLPPLRPLLGKGQAQAKVRASGSRHLVWHSELSIHRPARPPGIGVTRWVWQSTFALTSWPPVTAAAERLGLGQGTGSTGWWGMGEERWLREEEMEVWRRAAKREGWFQREGKRGFWHTQNTEEKQKRASFLLESVQRNVKLVWWSQHIK